MLEVVGDVVMILGAALVLLGLVGVLRFKDFTLQLLAGSKTDTVGFFAIVLGLCLRSGFTWFTAKALLILAVVVVANPVVASAIAAGHARQQARVEQDRTDRTAGEGED
ncbi:Na+/H+ antiporter subunit [Xylanimonas cellulosilytica DSM 15894]|uniref:Na+/H+ antiporter subunit n=1 Tax=Xylanimonas cellulosilytica (strain DSM 15894 / JCM 12276 / CECT 5975 / KCTC 9989 / LMG 20990 / NBRC 107835 / XIL07) TaxID=446471 RepID=D1BT21_XYLCX|nr:monovalent cation/H(+) antiporter subunit G [Xylanimonas cellulosilytica]ACZ30863.1 Na+/H+ antiporter subunit [Xylanimonas cellulosilytica DSM 15894]